MTSYTITVTYKIPDGIVKSKAEASFLARKNIGVGYGNWLIEED